MAKPEGEQKIEQQSGALRTPQDQLHHFLMQVIGYGKIPEILAANAPDKPESRKVAEILEGTILGTSYDRWSPISKIKNSKEAARYIRRFDLKINRSPFLQPELPFHFASNSHFYGFGMPNGTDETQTYFEQHIRPVLTDGTATSERISTQLSEHTITADDYYLYIRGGYGSTTKIITASFNLSPEVVAEINALVSKYQALKRMPSPQHQYPLG